MHAPASDTLLSALLQEYQAKKEQEHQIQKANQIIEDNSTLAAYYHSFQSQLNSLFESMRVLYLGKIDQSVPLTYAGGAGIASLVAEKLNVPGAGLITTGIKAGYRYKEKLKNQRLAVFFSDPRVQYEQVDHLARYMTLYRQEILLNSETSYHSRKEQAKNKLKQWAHKPIHTPAQRCAEADIEKLTEAITAQTLKAPGKTLLPLVKAITGQEMAEVSLNTLLPSIPIQPQAVTITTAAFVQNTLNTPLLEEKKEDNNNSDSEIEHTLPAQPEPIVPVHTLPKLVLKPSAIQLQWKTQPQVAQKKFKRGNEANPSARYQKPQKQRQARLPTISEKEKLIAPMTPTPSQALTANRASTLPINIPAAQNASTAVASLPSTPIKQ